MKYSTRRRSRRSLYGEYRKKIAEAKKELVKYRNDTNMALVAMIPAEYKGGFAAAGVHKYRFGRLCRLLRPSHPAQRKQIRNICRQAGPAYGAINNTPERSIETVETYKVVYERCLTPTRRNASILNEHSGGTGRKMGWCDGTTQGTFVTWLPRILKNPY